MGRWQRGWVGRKPRFQTACTPSDYVKQAMPLTFMAVSAMKVSADCLHDEPYFAQALAT